MKCKLDEKIVKILRFQFFFRTEFTRISEVLKNVNFVHFQEQPRRKRRNHDTNHDSNPFPTMQGELAVASPTVEDMIIAYSTIPGYVSQRDHETGTWFIQALVETFMDKACDHELIDLLRLTSEYLSKFTNDRGEKQTCNIEMRHLYKKIYLKPGTRNDRRISDATLSPLMKRSHSTPPSSPKNHRKQ